MIEIIENTILENIKSRFEGFEIDSFPVDFEKYGFLSPKGCILLRYEKSPITAQKTVYSVNCDEVYNFTVFMALRYLQKHNQAFPYLKKLKTTLNAMPILTKKLCISEYQFEDEINGDLWYSFDINITFPLKDEYSDSSNAGNILALVKQKT